MLYGRKCPPTETIPALVSRIFGLIWLFGVSVGAQITVPTAGQALRLDLPSKLCWTLKNEYLDGEKIASDNEHIYYIILNTGRVNSVSIASGAVEWTSDLGGQIKTSPYILRGGLFIVTQNDAYYTFRRLDKTTGLTVWQTQIVRPTNAPPPEIYLHSLDENLITAATDGSFHALDLESGRINRSAFNPGGMTTRPYFEGSRVIFGRADQRIIVFSLNDFTVSSESATVPSAASAVLKSNDSLIWGDALGIVHLSNRQRKSASVKPVEKWRFRTGGSISDLALTNRGTESEVLISSLDNFLYLVSLKTGKLIWKKRLSGRPAFAPRTAGDYLILNDIDSASASVLEISLGRTVNRINLPEGGFFTGAAQVAPQSVIFVGTGGLYAFAFQAACKS